MIDMKGLPKEKLFCEMSQGNTISVIPVILKNLIGTRSTQYPKDIMNSKPFGATVNLQTTKADVFSLILGGFVLCEQTVQNQKGT